MNSIGLKIFLFKILNWILFTIVFVCTEKANIIFRKAHAPCNSYKWIKLYSESKSIHFNNRDREKYFWKSESTILVCWIINLFEFSVSFIKIQRLLFTYVSRCEIKIFSFKDPLKCPSYGYWIIDTFLSWRYITETNHVYFRRYDIIDVRKCM